MATNKGDKKFTFGGVDRQIENVLTNFKNASLNDSDKQKLKARDVLVSGDPFGVKKKGSLKNKSDVVHFLHTKYKQKYKDLFIKAARDQNMHVQHVEDLVEKELTKGMAEAFFQGGSISRLNETYRMHGPTAILSKTHEALDNINHLTGGVGDVSKVLSDTIDSFKIALPSWLKSLCLVVIVSETLGNLVFREKWDTTLLLMALGAVMWLELADDSSYTHQLLAKIQSLAFNAQTSYEDKQLCFGNCFYTCTFCFIYYRISHVGFIQRSY
jgi:hypothetical protein